MTCRTSRATARMDRWMEWAPGVDEVHPKFPDALDAKGLFSLTSFCSFAQRSGSSTGFIER